MDRDQIINLIRNTLRCSCPDEVFHTISREGPDNQDILYSMIESADPKAVAGVDAIVSVGSKLIVVICGTVKEEDLAQLVSKAVSVRDRMNFNRARIVLKKTRISIDTVDRLMAKFDNRVHLHTLYDIEVV